MSGVVGEDFRSRKVSKLLLATVLLATACSAGAQSDKTPPIETQDGGGAQKSERAVANRSFSTRLTDKGERELAAASAALSDGPAPSNRSGPALVRGSWALLDSGRAAEVAQADVGVLRFDGHKRCSGLIHTNTAGTQ